jgi:hypothetical protein
MWRYLEDEALISVFERKGLETSRCSVAILSTEHTKLRRLVADEQERVFADDVTLDAPGFSG